MIKTKVNIKGYIYNKNENNKIIISKSGIKTNNIINYIDNNIKTTIQYTKQKIIIKRENNEFLNILSLEQNKKTISTYILKSNNITLALTTYTDYISIKDSIIEVKYKIIEDNNNYIYRIEVINLHENK